MQERLVDWRGLFEKRKGKMNHSSSAKIRDIQIEHDTGIYQIAIPAFNSWDCSYDYLVVAV